MITRVLPVLYLLKAGPNAQIRDEYQQTDGQMVERPSDRLPSSGCRVGQGAEAGRWAVEGPLSSSLVRPVLIQVPPTPTTIGK